MINGIADRPRASASDRNAGLIQGLLLTCVPVMVVMTTCVTLPILPAIMRAFSNQPNIAELAPLVAVVPTLAVALTSIAAGVLGEKLGRRNLLILGMAVFAVSAVMPIWLTSFVAILVSRAVAGLALGAMLTSAVALTGDYYSGVALQRWLAAHGGVGALVGVVASIASGALGEINWRFAFLPLFAVFLFSLCSSRSLRRGHAAANAARSATSGKGEPTPWPAWLSIFSVAIVGSAIIFPPVFELGVIMHEKALGSSGLAGVAIGLVAAAASIGAFGLNWLQRLSAPAKAALALVSAGIGTFLIAQTTTLAPLMLGVAFVGAGQGMLGPVLSIWLLERTPDWLRGLAVGAYTTVISLTVFVAPLVERWAAVDLGSSSAAMRLYASADFVVAVAVGTALLRPRSDSLIHKEALPSGDDLV